MLPVRAVVGKNIKNAVLDNSSQFTFLDIYNPLAHQY